MLNGIGNQVRFGFKTSSAEIMQKYPERTANESVATSSIGAQSTDGAAPKKSHKVLYTTAGIAVVAAGITALGHFNKLPKMLQKHYATAEKSIVAFYQGPVKTKANDAWEATKGAYHSVKDKRIKSFQK